MATVLERDAHSVYRMFSTYYVCFYILIVSYFGFEGGAVVLNAPVPGHC